MKILAQHVFRPRVLIRGVLLYFKNNLYGSFLFFFFCMFEFYFLFQCLKLTSSDLLEMKLPEMYL